MQAIVVERVDQRLQHMFLPHHFTEYARPPFTGEYLIAHESKCLIIRALQYISANPKKHDSGHATGLSGERL
ncbi:hypothetical protein R50072_10520 [Simiduia litorea]